MSSAKIARDRIYGDELRLELPRGARSHDQLRQHKPEIITCPHEESPSISRKATPRSKASRWRWVSRHGRFAARRHGDVQCVVRPRARHRVRRQHRGGRQARAGTNGCMRRSISASRPRIHQVGRSAGLIATFRQIDGARLQGRRRRPWARSSRARRRIAGEPDPRSGKVAYPEVRKVIPPKATRARSRRRQSAGGGAEAGHRLRSVAARPQA